YRKEQLRRLQEEVIEMEDLKTGVSITDLGLNDFRMDLLNYIKTHGDLASVPTGMNAVVPADPARGLPPGVMFTLRNRNNSVNINQQNRLHPYYLIYVSQSGEVVADHTEVKRLLDLVRSACKGRSQPVAEVDLKEDKDIDSLFSGGHTTALVNTIAGLDDFELIAFLVIQAPE
ncbi:MAG: ATP-dependent helicase, partial [Deltaproteobacteria bacterium]|nr:ATP-dependent helicase [Deltaproteobacteria bacterium]